MKKLVSLFFFVSLFVIATFLLFSDFEIYVENHLNSTNSLAVYSLLSFVFLLSDIILPVPSSLIMILNGKILGFFSGTLLSLAAGLTSSSIGFYLGKLSEKYLNRLFSENDVKRANKFMDRYGKMSVALSRGIPILSETMAVLTGTTKMRFSVFILFAFIGHLIVSLVYAWVGAFTKDLSGHLVTVLVVGITLLISWLVSFLLKRKSI